MFAKFRRKLTLADLAPFPDAVAGHEGVLSDINHDFVIKPCTDQEVTFYEECSRRHCELKTMMPLYYGTLALAAPDLKQVLEQQQNPAASIADALPQLQAGTPTHLPAKARGRMLETNRAIVLENLTLPFERPNIMDIKLGIRLWADDATPEKRRKLDAVSAETTSGSLGLRVAGMKVWDPVATAGMKDGYREFDKMYGRAFDERTIRTPFQEFFYERSADGRLVLTPERRRVVEGIALDVRRIQKLMEKEETRMYSTSLLLIIEGDREALQRARENEKASKKDPPPEDNEGEYVLQDEDEEEEEDEDEETEFLTCSASLIDFAHAAFTPNLGPDENTLRGIRNVRVILDSILRVP